MATKTISTKKVKNQTKLEKIEQIYGKDKTGVNLDLAKKHLDKIGFKSLGKILQAR